jgi:ribose 5-phosphate isomerase B
MALPEGEEHGINFDWSGKLPYLNEGSYFLIIFVRINNGCICMGSDDVPVAICSDHAGFQLKEQILDWLTEQKIPFINFGTYSPDSCDYPDFAHPLAESIEEGESKMGIAICGSGQGMSMTLNKHKGIRAALCWSPEIASLARQHNDANVCCLPARFVDKDTALEIIRRFFATSFEGGRHQARIDKIPIW